MADFTPRKKIALDNNKLNLSAPSTAQGKTASLIWGFHKNNPRITVWTRDPADETERNNKGKIQAELNLPVLFSLFETIRHAADSAPGWKDKLENKNFTFFGGKRSETAVVTTEIWCGKDAEGFVYISVTAPNRPIIKFRIQPDDFHTWYESNGEKASAERIAKTYVKGYIRILEDIYSHISITEYVDRAAEMAAKNGQGGGFNRGGQGGNNNQGGGFNRGSGGGYQKPAENSFNDVMDNLPF